MLWRNQLEIINNRRECMSWRKETKTELHCNCNSRCDTHARKISLLLFGISFVISMLVVAPWIHIQCELRPTTTKKNMIARIGWQRPRLRMNTLTSSWCCCCCHVPTSATRCNCFTFISRAIVHTRARIQRRPLSLSLSHLSCASPLRIGYSH